MNKSSFVKAIVFIGINFFYSLSLFSQTEWPTDAKVLKVNNGFIVYRTFTSRDTAYFTAVKYDNEAKKLKDYSLGLKKQVVNSSVYFKYYNNLLSFEFINGHTGRTGLFLLLDEALNEVSKNTYTEKMWDEHRAIIKKKDSNHFIPDPYLNRIDLLSWKDSSFYQFESVKKEYILRRLNLKENTLWPVYSKGWEIQIDNKEILVYRFFQEDKKQVFLYVDDDGKDFFGQYIYSIDNMSGRINYRVKLNSTNKDVMSVSNMLFDNEKNVLLVTGSYENETEGYFFSIIDSKGNIISQRKVPYKDYTAAGLNKNAVKGQVLAFKKIIKNNKGNYIAVAENVIIRQDKSPVKRNAFIPTNTLCNYNSFGFTILEFSSDNLKTIDSSYTPISSFSPSKISNLTSNGGYFMYGMILNTFALPTGYLGKAVILLGEPFEAMDYIRENGFCFSDFYYDPKTNNKYLLFKTAFNEKPNYDEQNRSWFYVIYYGDKQSVKTLPNEKIKKFTPKYLIKNIIELYKFQPDNGAFEILKAHPVIKE